MGEMTISTRNVFMEGQTGRVLLSEIESVEDVGVTTTTEDPIRVFTPEQMKLKITIPPYSLRRTRRALMGWKAKGPLRFRQLVRAMIRLEREAIP